MKTTTAGQVTRGFPLPLMALALILVLGAFGCSQAAAPGATGGPVPEELTVGLGDDVPIFSAIRTFGGNSNFLTQNIYESLVRRDPAGEVIPALASSWEISPDGKSYTFTLRKGATYVNGDPVTAEDVRFRFAALKDPKIVPNQSTYAHWDRVEVVDDKTVRYVLSFPDAGFLRTIGTGYVQVLVPNEYYKKIGGEEAFEKTPIGSGPYKVVERKVKEGWTLERYEGYWGEKPQVRKATFKVIPEPSTRAAAMKVGEIDFSVNFPPSFMEDLEKTGGFRLLKNPTSNTMAIRINKIREIDPSSGKPNPFRDKRVRQAMAYSIDRDAMINKLLKGMGERVAMLFPGDIGYDPELKPWPYDPNKAKQLLAEAGYPNGFDATYYGLLGERFPLSKEVGETVAQYLTAVGIRTKVVNEEYAAWVARTTQATSWDKPNELNLLGYGCCYMGGQMSPYLAWRQLTCADRSQQWTCDPEFDKQVELLRLEGDPKKVEEMARSFARKAHDEQWEVVLYRSVVIYAMKDRIEFTPTVNSPFAELRNLRWTK